MSTTRFDIAQMLNLLHRSERDVAVRGFFGESIETIARDEFFGSLEFPADGVEVAFRTAQLLDKTDVVDPDELFLCAFFLRRDRHEGYSQYRGGMPNGLAFHDLEADVVRKMGTPMDSGSAFLIMPEETREVRWVRYPIDNSFMHVQFDAHGVNQVTLMSTKP